MAVEEAGVAPLFHLLRIFWGIIRCSPKSDSLGLEPSPSNSYWWNVLIRYLRCTESSARKHLSYAETNKKSHYSIKHKKLNANTCNTHSQLLGLPRIPASTMAHQYSPQFRPTRAYCTKTLAGWLSICCIMFTCFVDTSSESSKCKSRCL